MKLKNTGNVIPVRKLPDGRIGIIESWTVGGCVGQLVQKYGKSLIKLGAPSGEGWSNVSDYGDTCKVRLLNNGDLLEVTNN